MAIRSILALLVGCLFVYPVLAFAHEGFKGSYPKANEIVTGSVREIRLDFSAKPELAVTSISVTNSRGDAIELSALTLTKSSIVVPIRHTLSPDRYQVQWKTAGRDGHPISGSFAFEVAGDAMAPMEIHHDTVTLPSSTSFNAESPAFVVIRFVQFTALVVLLGAFAFWHIVLRLLRRNDEYTAVRDRINSRHVRLTITAALILLLIGVIRLIAQSYAVHAEGESVFAPAIPIITGTTWGIGWLVQLAGSLVVLAGLGLAQRNQKGGWNVATLGALALAFFPALSGHAASSPHLPAIAIASDALHVIGAGGWLGSLVFVLIVGIPAALTLETEFRANAVANLANAFSPTALMFAVIVAVTGVFAGWLHIGSIRGIYETTYGRTLLVKLALLSLVAGTGAYNWLRIKPGLTKSENTTRLKRTATTEIAIAALVLAVTAVLVATPTAIDEELSRKLDSPPGASP